MAQKIVGRALRCYRATTMFVRFRQATRLQVSLIETRRVGGKVRHEHVASFGAIATPPSVADRIQFWQRLHDRLDKLANRLDAATQSKILGEVHERIPMVTLDEQHDLKLQNAESDQQFWAGLRDMNQATAEGQRGLAAAAGGAAAGCEAEAAKADANAAVAKERVERLKKGEDVPGGLGRPFTREDCERILRDAGFTTSDFRNLEIVHEVSELGGFEEMLKETHKMVERAERAASRAVLRRLLSRDSE